MKAILWVFSIAVLANGCLAERVLVLPGFWVDFDEAIEGEVSSVGVEGVSIQPEAGGPLVVLPWFAVDARGDGWEVPRAYTEIAQESRIGYARRRRGDLAGCAAMYIGFAVDLVGSDSRMGREVFEGLLDDAILRGDLYDASVALTALGLSFGKRMAAVDERYGVHTGIPLVGRVSDAWDPVTENSEGHRLGLIADALDEIDADMLLIERFKRLDESRFDLDSESDRFGTPRVPSGEMTVLGEEIYQRMYTAQKHPDAETRIDARRWLQSRAQSKSGSWVDLWCRLALGASFLRESQINDDDSLCSLGVVHLLHVVVRFQDQHPLLVRIAKEMAIGALVERGRVQEAAEIMGTTGL